MMSKWKQSWKDEKDIDIKLEQMYKMMKTIMDMKPSERFKNMRRK